MVFTEPANTRYIACKAGTLAPVRSDEFGDDRPHVQQLRHPFYLEHI